MIYFMTDSDVLWGLLLNEVIYEDRRYIIPRGFFFLDLFGSLLDLIQGSSDPLRCKPLKTYLNRLLLVLPEIRTLVLV